MILVAVVTFRNEERFLGTLLQSLSEQVRPPDLLLLVDDASTDESRRMAEEFAARHQYARVLSAPPKPASGRFPTDVEFRWFMWAMGQVDQPYDIAAKLDADLRLTPSVFAEMERCFADDPELGLAGPVLIEENEKGVFEPLVGRPEHVNGATKFYRRACYEDILPHPPITGWDMVDEVKARMRGWRTATIPMPDGDSVHLRPMGRQGNFRRFRRWGQGDYANGTHPALVAVVAFHRLSFRPRVIGSLSYLTGWAVAALRRIPRFDADVRAFARHEQRDRVRRRLRGFAGGAGSARRSR